MPVTKNLSERSEEKKNRSNNYCYSYENVSSLATVVQSLDSAIHRINHYPADKC